MSLNFAGCGFVARFGENEQMLTVMAAKMPR